MWHSGLSRAQPDITAALLDPDQRGEAYRDRRVRYDGSGRQRGRGRGKSIVTIAIRN